MQTKNSKESQMGLNIKPLSILLSISALLFILLPADARRSNRAIIRSYGFNNNFNNNFNNGYFNYSKQRFLNNSYYGYRPYNRFNNRFNSRFNYGFRNNGICYPGYRNNFRGNFRNGFGTTFSNDIAGFFLDF